MRALFILLLALGITLLWQSSVVATVSVEQSYITAEAGKDVKNKGKEELEPEGD